MNWSFRQVRMIMVDHKLSEILVIGTWAVIHMSCDQVMQLHNNLWVIIAAFPFQVNYKMGGAGVRAVIRFLVARERCAPVAIIPLHSCTDHLHNTLFAVSRGPIIPNSIALVTAHESHHTTMAILRYRIREVPKIARFKLNGYLE